MTPTERNPRPLGPTPLVTSEQVVRPVQIERPVYRWYHKLSAAILIGLGIANLFLAIGETFRLRRFGGRG